MPGVDLSGEDRTPQPVPSGSRRRSSQTGSVRLLGSHRIPDLFGFEEGAWFVASNGRGSVAAKLFAMCFV